MELAARLNGEIVNCDSIQIYRGFDVGSAKPSAADRQSVPHHLFDFVDADEPFTAADFSAHASRVCREILARGRSPIVVGGTGFYLRALLAGLPALPSSDPAMRSRLQKLRSNERGRARLFRLLQRVDPPTALRLAPGDSHRIERALEVYFSTGKPISSWERPTASTPPRWSAIKFALDLERETLVARLDARVASIYANGLLEETAELLTHYQCDAAPFQSIGYREAVRHLSGSLSLGEAINQTRQRTRAYAKRQRTWFRGEVDTHWLDAASSISVLGEQALQLITAR